MIKEKFKLSFLSFFLKKILLHHKQTKTLWFLKNDWTLKDKIFLEKKCPIYY